MQSSILPDAPVAAQPAEDLALTPAVILRSVRKNWLVIVVTVALGLLAGRLYTSWQKPIFEAATTVQLDPQPLQPLRDVPAEMGRDNYWTNVEYIATETEVLQSRQTATLVVQKLGLHRDAAFLNDERGVSEQKVNVAPEIAAGVLRSRLQVAPIKDSRLIQVKYRDADPERAVRVLSALADVYVDRNLDSAMDSTSKKSEWLDAQLLKLKAELEAQEMELYNYKRQNNLLSVSYDDQSNMLRAEIQQLNVALTELKTRRQGIEARVAVLRDINPEDPADIPRSDLLGSASLTKARDAFLDAERQLAESRAEGRGANHPQMLAAQAGVQEARRALVGELKNLKTGLSADLNAVNRELGGVTKLFETAKHQALELNLNDLRYTRLRRSKESTEKLFSEVLQQSSESGLSKVMHFNNVRVLDRPVLPRQPISPRPLANLAVGLAFGLALGFAGAIGRELLDRTIRNAEDAEATLGLPLLGSLPSVSDRGGRATYGNYYGRRSRRERAKAEGADAIVAPELLVSTHPTSSLAEAARAIRTNLMFMSPDQPYRTVLVTSPGPREGKTTVASSIALVMAQAGQRVCLVDCDLRRPRLHSLFTRTHSHGVSTTLLDLSLLDTISLETHIPGLHVLPAGPMPPNPADLMHSEAFGRLIEMLKERFDRVVIDSPPIGLVTDGVIISTRVDAAVFVVRALKTRRDAARRALRALQDVGTNCTGFVLNAATAGERYDYAVYYGGSRQEAEPAMPEKMSA